MTSFFAYFTRMLQVDIFIFNKGFYPLKGAFYSHFFKVVPRGIELKPKEYFS